VVGLITNNDETAYREEVRDLVVWCQDNISLNVEGEGDDCGLQEKEDRARPQDLAWAPQILKRFYSCTIESILTGCITAWYCNCSAFDRKALQGPSFLKIQYFGIWKIYFTDGTRNLFVLSQTETILILATRKCRSDFCIVHL
jgi:hypothetical protein